MPERYWTIFQYGLLELRDRIIAGDLQWDDEFDGDPPTLEEIDELVNEVGTWDWRRTT